MGRYTAVYNRVKNNLLRQCTSGGILEDFVKTNNGVQVPNIIYGNKEFQNDGQENVIFIDIEGGQEKYFQGELRNGEVSVLIDYEVGYSGTNVDSDYIPDHLEIIEKIADSIFTGADGNPDNVLPFDSGQGGSSLQFSDPEARGNLLRGGLRVSVETISFLMNNRREA